MSGESRPKPAVLMVLDGYGVAPESDGNTIRRASTPVFDGLVHNYPAMTLRASGEEVGLSWGEMGNSQVGHLAIGTGRVNYQLLPRINKSIESGEFQKNEALLQAIEFVKESGGTIHLVGMISPGGIHSHQTHCFELLKTLKEHKIKTVPIHVILDGRDSVFNAGADFVGELQKAIKSIKLGTIASLSGRYYAMDRDSRWDRTKKAYDAMVLGVGETAEDPLRALKDSYVKEVYDEEFLPTVITKKGKPTATVKEGDAVVFFNFRSDRMRQLVKAFVMPDFSGFERSQIQNLFPVTMAEYEAALPVEVMFPPIDVENCLAEVLSKAGLKQLHIAETEKYAHVTFFFNGAKEVPFEGEERVIIPSPSVPSYDQAPEMSAPKLSKKVVEVIEKGEFDVIIMNFANADMVGHTGNREATKKAIEALDVAIGKISEAVLARDGVLLITADHGNAEEQLNLRTGEMNKEHATNPVPFLIVANKYKGQPSIAGEVPDGDLSLMPPVGMLADVAPTLLHLLGIEIPPEMTGQPLIT